MQIGDWVRSYSMGIWRIYRILTGFHEIRPSLNESKSKTTRTIVFSQRLVNDKWKRSFSSECCNASFIKPMTAHEQQELTAFINANPTIVEVFNKTSPKPINLIWNVSFSLPVEKTGSSA